MLERELVSRMLSELPPLAPGGGPRRSPRRRADNPFLSPPRATDPPPPWLRAGESAGAAAPRRSAPGHRAGRGSKSHPRARRASALPFVVAAMVAVLGIGLWCDAPARAEVLSTLARAASQAGALLIDVLLR